MEESTIVRGRTESSGFVYLMQGRHSILPKEFWSV